MTTMRPFMKSLEEIMSDEKIITLDLTDCKYLGELHERIRVAFNFPEWYGANWDAFWDCLTDMVGDPINIEVRGLEVIERKFNAFFVK